MTHRTLGTDQLEDDGPCMLAAERLDDAMGAGLMSWSPSTDPMDADSGIPALNASLGVLLVHMSRFFAVTPDFGFIVEDEGPNAFASQYSRTGNGYGTVVFGRRLLEIELARTHGDYAVMAICAHEFGHIRQFKDGYFPRIEASLPVYCRELQADFAAGAFVAYWKRMMKPEHLLRIGDSWSALGSSDFNRPGSHGTKLQRVTAIEAGFFFRDRRATATIEDVMEAGFLHVSQYG